MKKLVLPLILCGMFSGCVTGHTAIMSEANREADARGVAAAGLAGETMLRPVGTGLLQAGLLPYAGVPAMR